IASITVDRRAKPIWLYILLGMVGAIVGGFLFSQFAWRLGIAGFNLYSMIVAIVGSIVTLLSYNATRGEEAREPTPAAGTTRQTVAQQIDAHTAGATPQTVAQQVDAVVKGVAALQETKPRVFISYRREDGAQAGRISDRLRRDLGDNQIF